MKAVLLVNMPFAEVVYPSLALGLFKARFQKEGISCDVEYLNILFAEMVGWENYSIIGKTTALFAGEQMFAHALFGNTIPDDTQYYTDVVSKASPEVKYRLQQMKTQVIPFLQYCLERIPWYLYDIIGFTSMFEQNLPSLALASLVKQHFPSKIIVFGGANCEDIMGLTMHKCFPFIDYVFSGEADDTFPELVKRLNDGFSVHDIPGIVYRDKEESIYIGDALKIDNLDSLPFPNYDEYYQCLQNSPLSPWLNLNLPLETSRGCWWGQKVQCTFCGLNGQYLSYRCKSVPRIVDEISYLIKRYNVPFMRVVDNVLNPLYYNDLLPEIAIMKLNTQFYFEVRPNLQKHQIKILSEVGATIQVGIENLSTHILKLMRKGTSSLRNIQSLKWCKQYGITAYWNMIFGFPGEISEDYARCHELSNILTHLNPPSGFGLLRMDRFSDCFENADDLGFLNIRSLDIYKYLYPFDEGTLYNLVYYFDYDYQEKRDFSDIYYNLEKQVFQWKYCQDQLYCQMANDQLIITDTRPIATTNKITLKGIRKHIYECCDKIRSVKQIQEWLNERYKRNISEDQIMNILDEYIEKKLMVKENNLYLSLAVMTNTHEHEIK